ncbi:uncharacterized protein RJT20DRAFT_131205 [Scheffersomyces xylosifermentans]|uniref:uncharacterized protein n=1 Tax=Scheffersomyces xylosifermentans TaxID=1304137 RepID=UPI00315CF876
MFRKSNLFSKSSGRRLCSCFLDGLKASFGTSNIANENIVSVTDLYLGNAKSNSSRRVTYEGMKPSLYTRSVRDFQSNCFERHSIGNTSILNALDQDRDFEATISPRTEKIQNFVGIEFPLSLKEKIAIICGLSNFHLDIRQQQTAKTTPEENHLESKNATFPSQTVLIETERLRALGKIILRTHLDIETVFMNERYLSSPTNEIFDSLDFFDNEREIIPEFMKRNLLFTAILPYRGAMKWGAITEEHLLTETKNTILEQTCIGSLYTLIGLLTMKFNKNEVRDKVLLGKIINGRLGMINLTSETLTRS